MEAMQLDPYAPQSLADPVAFWTRLRREAPVLEVPGSPGHFLVSRHEEVRLICSRPEIFSNELVAISQLGPDGRPRLTTAPASGTPHGRVLGATDGEPHARHRRLLVRALSARRMRRVESWVRERARSLVGEAAGEHDAIDTLAGPLPVQTMLHLLGLPAEDWRRLWAWSGPVQMLMGGFAAPEAIERLSREVDALQDYLAPFVDPSSNRDAGAAPEAESIAAILREAVATGELEIWEARGLLLQLVVGGSETTIGLIAAAIRRIASDPAVARALREDVESIVPFLEETNRLDGPAVGSYRRTTVDTELAGIAIPAGSTLTILWSSANRDERVFSDADRFEPTRPDRKAHLGFGHGTHFCIGAALARTETRAIVEALLAQYRTIELGPGAEPARFMPSLLGRRLATLPLRLVA